MGSNRLCCTTFLLFITPWAVLLGAGGSMVQADAFAPKKSNLVDLSWVINDKMMSWSPLNNYTKEYIINGDAGLPGLKLWVRAESIRMGIHLGTHMDAPVHFIPNNWSVDEIPIEHFFNVPLVVVDVTRQVKEDKSYQITISDLQSFEEEHGPIPDAGVIFFRTGFGRFWPDPKKYVGTETYDFNLMRHPGLHEDAANWLVKNRSLLGVGIDCLSIDAGGAGHSVHQIVLDRNIYIIENLNDKLSYVPPTGARVTMTPLRLEDMSGSPVRVIVDTNSALLMQPTLFLFSFLMTMSRLFS